MNTALESALPPPAQLLLPHLLNAATATAATPAPATSMAMLSITHHKVWI